MATELELLPLQSLTIEERRELLRIARASVRAALGGPQSALESRAPPALWEPSGAFVSLRHEEQLRGCVGTLEADRPLIDTVARMARAAALDDVRFPQLREAELPALHIEISRVSALVPAHPEQVRPGHHGVSLRRDDRRAVFLPQVASHHHWDRVTLLTELCRKAMLPADAWQLPDTCLMVFCAEVFEDGDET